MEIGLTGGIGSGKSTVSRMLAALGARVIDADVLARRALEPGGPAYDAAVAAFGEGILNPDGTVDRAELARIVFAEPDKRALLESIVHPVVFEMEEEMVRRFRDESPDAVVVFDATLLIESGAYARMDKVVVVWCSPGTQLSRLVGMKGMDPQEARRRMSAQMPLEQKRAYADHIIDNDGSVDETKRQVGELYSRLRQYV